MYVYMSLINIKARESPVYVGKGITIFYQANALLTMQLRQSPLNEQQLFAFFLAMLFCLHYVDVY